MPKKIRCCVMRGGTSRALFFRREDLPEDPELQKKIFIQAMGTPDPKQVDGLGGTTSSTSKVAIVSKSSRPGFDVDYTFAQVGVDKPMVEFSGNCGNISSAVGPFAVDEGMVNPREPITQVNIYNTNTGKKIMAEVPVKNGFFHSAGNFTIPGVIQKGSEIKLRFYQPEGAMTGKLFPTGSFIDDIEVDGSIYNVSVMDCTNPYVFVDASRLGLKGTEPPEVLDRTAAFNVMQKIRKIIGEKLGIEGEAFPKICAVSPPCSHLLRNGIEVRHDEINIISRVISMGKTHKTIPLTAALCLGAAAVVKDSIPGQSVRNLLDSISKDNKVVKIGHPEGVIEVKVDCSYKDTQIKIESVACSRTARRIMEGYILVDL